MLTNQNLSGEFELIKVSYRNKSTNSDYCKIDDKKRSFSIPTKFARELDWESKQRVNLYRFGETFMLKPDKVGLVTVHNYKGILRVTSVNFCIEILSRTKSCREFEAWTEDNALFFKPKKGEE